MTEKMKNILIGLFVVTAVTLVIGMILFLNPQVGDGKKTLEVRFANISGIMPGTRVTFAGKPVGELTSIQEIQEARELAVDDSGRVYPYLLTLKIDSSVHVFTCDEISTKTAGLMGEKAIAILPKLAQKGQTATIITDQILTANSIDPLEHTFSQISKVSQKMEGTLGHLDTWFVDNQQNLSESILSFNQCMGSGNEVLSSVNNSELVPSLTQATYNLNDNLEFIKAELVDNQPLYKISHLAETLTESANAFNTDGALAMQNINQITRDLSRGTGTIGKLITGDDMYLRISSLMSKAEVMMNDVNHYGLLFQYDKGWQRIRTKKANLLKSLDTPRDFRGYFEGEVDSITTSLGRLTELLEIAGKERSQLADNEQFKRQFCALLRSAESLSNSLKLYNEGLLTDNED